jgi:outer membrane protein OmpA-like peptidoglycan-associated protein
MDNKIAWEFMGAKWVILKGNVAKEDTMNYKGYITVKPDTLDRTQQYTFVVKYTDGVAPTVYTYRDYVYNSKIVFRPSVLRSMPNKDIKLTWATRGLKNIRLTVDGEVFDNQPAMGDYTFVFTKDTEVILEGTDQFGEINQQSWRIRNTQRPFIRNTISYSEVKRDNKIRRIGIDIFEVDRTEFPKQVKIKMIVADTLGNFIRELAPPELNEAESRRIFKEIIETNEYGKSDYITNFKVREINESIAKPHDVALCLDHSGSIEKYLPAIHKATANILNNKGDGDSFSIVRFSSDLLTDTRMMRGSNALVNVWNNRKGIYLTGTALYAGIDTALDTFDSTSTNQKVLFLLTDGQENSSFAFAAKGKAFNVQQVAEKARRLGIKIFPIGLGTGVNEQLLQDLAWLTDGKLMQGYEAKDIESIYEELTRSFRNYYEITYTPKQKEEGKHDISLKYHNHRKEVISQAKFFIGNKFKVFENTSFVSSRNKAIAKQPLIPKQAVAFFDVSKDDLKPIFMPNLDAIAVFLKNNPQTRADILGHTDLTGTDEKNMELSKRRAQS